MAVGPTHQPERPYRRREDLEARECRAEAGAPAGLLVGLEEVDRPLLTQSDRAETPL